MYTSDWEGVLERKYVNKHYYLLADVEDDCADDQSLSDGCFSVYEWDGTEYPQFFYVKIFYDSETMTILGFEVMRMEELDGGPRGYYEDRPVSNWNKSCFYDFMAKYATRDSKLAQQVKTENERKWKKAQEEKIAKEKAEREKAEIKKLNETRILTPQEQLQALIGDSYKVGYNISGSKSTITNDLSNPETVEKAHKLLQTAASNGGRITSFWFAEALAILRDSEELSEIDLSEGMAVIKSWESDNDLWSEFAYGYLVRCYKFMSESDWEYINNRTQELIACGVVRKEENLAGFCDLLTRVKSAGGLDK